MLLLPTMQYMQHLVELSTSNHKIAFSSVWPCALHIVFAYAGRKGKTVCFLSFRVTGYTATTQSLGNFRNMVVLCIDISYTLDSTFG